MRNPWVRRDFLGGAAAGGIAAQFFRPDTAGVEKTAGGDRVALPGNVAMLPLFVGAAGQRLPENCTLVWSGGYSRPGHGSASYHRDGAVDRAYVKSHPHTAFVDADGRGFRLATRSVDVRQTGAIGDGVADDGAAIQEALAVVEASGGGMVFLPPGTYRITAPVRLPPQTGLQGAGPTAVLHANGCDGLVLEASDGIGPRAVSDFMIQGHGCERNRAIVVDHPDGRRSQGMAFERLYIAFFGTAVFGRGLWHATFRTVVIDQVWNGLMLVGRNIKILIDDCRITHGGMLRGEGISNGIQVGDAAPLARPEDVQVSKTIIYGFDRAIFWRTALFGGVSHCDLDACGRVGIEIVTADGGFTFRDNWIQTTGTSALGINCPPLGYQPLLTNIAIVNNAVCSTEGSTGTCGIAVREGQCDVTLDGNSVTGNWQDGIITSGARRVSVLNNRSAGNIRIERCAGVFIGRNFASARILVDDNSGLQTQPGFGPCSTGLFGQLDVPPGTVTRAATFTSLGLPDLPEGDYHTALSIYDPSQGSTGDVSAHVTRTAITVTLARPSTRSRRITFKVEML